MSYKMRNLEKSVAYLLKNFPVVGLLGARQTGKSTLLKRILPDAKFFDLEKDADFERVNSDPSLLLQETGLPLIFDEAQLSPSLFRALRVAVDSKRGLNGQFLISGSSSPSLLRSISETLAGRIAMLDVPTFTWNESLGKPQSKLYQCLASGEPLEGLQPSFSKAEISELCLRGGYPEPFLKRQDEIFFDLWMENYYKTYIERDVRALYPTLKLETYKRFIRMLAFSSGELINASNFARSLDVSQPTVKSYLSIAEGTFLWRQLLCYEKNMKRRIVKMPRGQLRDTGFLNYLLNINSVDALKSHPQFGRIWETFIMEQLLKNLHSSLIKVDSYFYRTHNQAEIDLVLEGRFGVIPIEIKAGTTAARRGLKTLETFIEEHHCPFGILINNGDEIYKLSQTIIQVPAIYL
jgi:uncharacterized protein